MLTLELLLRNIADTQNALPISIQCITNNSQDIKKNALFIAYPGERSDGRKYILQAIDNGAVAICYDPSDNFVLPEITIPAFPIKNLKIMQSTIAARFYDFPSSKMPVIGVTGTNGKTSITHFIAQCLNHCGVIGTIGYGFPGYLIKTPNTTPDAIFLQKIFAELIGQGAEAVAMEVSSHALDQQRVRDVQFHTAVFTNLTQDHLDYHKTMEKYRDAKELLFQQPGLKNAVINIDDETGIYFAEKYKNKLNIVTYSKKNNNATIFSEKFTPTEDGFELAIKTPTGNLEFHLPLIGDFNIDNVLAVIGVLDILKISHELIIKKLSSLKTVNGRMQLLRSKNSPAVIVDYAHTPDALEKALQSIRKHCAGKLICVFGCGGNRDKSKRPLMGAIAEKWADKIIITNDNPRNENPETIAHEIQQGITGSVDIVLDRIKAIEVAIQNADKEDWILIAGKGHEIEQIIGEKILHHNDCDCVLRAISKIE